MSRVLKITISASLLLNVLLAAVVIGHVSHSLYNPYKRHSIQEIAAALPADRGARFTETMQLAKERTASLYKQMNDAHSNATTLLKATPFSKEDYLAKIKEIHELHGQMLFYMAGQIAQMAEEFNPEDRAILADFLNHPPHPAGEF